MTQNAGRTAAALASLAVMTALALPGVRSVANFWSVKLPAPSLYAKDDPWRDYLAPEADCPGGEDAGASPSAQETTMRCLLDWARRKRGLPDLPRDPRLDSSSRLKAELIDSCDEFSHTPCGRPFLETFERVGYVSHTVSAATGENIAWGEAAAGAPRVVVDGWLNSIHHRENLFDPGWQAQGIALVRVSKFLDSGRSEIWVHEFGRVG